MTTICPACKRIMLTEAEKLASGGRAIEERMAAEEKAHLAAILRLESEAFDAWRRGDKTLAVSLSPREWVQFVEEMRDRRPRNFSRLLAEDTAQTFAALVETNADESLRLSLAVADLEYFLEDQFGRDKMRNEDVTKLRTATEDRIRRRQTPSVQISPELREQIARDIKQRDENQDDV